MLPAFSACNDAQHYFIRAGHYDYFGRLQVPTGSAFSEQVILSKFLE